MESGPAAWTVYERSAGVWARSRAGDVVIERAWLARFLGMLPRSGRVLDLGCGHGQPIADRLLHQGHPVTGLDLSPSLIELARERSPLGRWLVADMVSFDLGDTYDGVVMWHSLFHVAVDDQPDVFARIARHLRPAGPLLFTTGPALGSSTGTLGDDTLMHYSLAPAAYAELLETHGLHLVAHRLRDPECGDATVWLAQRS